MKYDYAVVIGRFQPYHNAHHKLVQHALTLGDKAIIVLGSAKTSPDVKNPFTPKVREAMIRACFDEETNTRLQFYPLRDYPYQEHLWIAELQNVVSQATNYDDASRIALVGHFKDSSSYYLRLFPQWRYEQFYDNSKETKDLNATDVRHLFFTRDLCVSWKNLVPKAVYRAMYEIKQEPTFEALQKEYQYIQDYKRNAEFKGLPFAPTFVTTDALVTAMGHVLVVKRGNALGKGKLALPGGFLAQGLTLEENAIKELREETEVKIPALLLKNSIKATHVFDSPKRSLRGRTITHAYHIELNPKMEDGLPKVKGGDDADKAFWLPIAEAREREDEFFEDHAHIIRHFLGF